MRDLFVRIDRLSMDQVERLRKRIDATSLKLEDVKQAKKDKWEEEAERLVSQIERDQATVASQLNRRVFIRAWCVILQYKVEIYASFF
jgi:sorting nexin-8